MNVDLGIWGKLTKIVWALFIVAAIGAVVMWYLPPIRQNERMRKEVLRLDGEIQKQETVSKQTHAAIDAMRDPKVIERIARDKLGFAKQDEVIVLFQPATNAAVR
ncbi:MAG: Septum formation initiator [Verrucomicrobiota bacterium]|jgi:cell division protein FtsB